METKSRVDTIKRLVARTMSRAELPDELTREEFYAKVRSMISEEMQGHTDKHWQGAESYFRAMGELFAEAYAEKPQDATPYQLYLRSPEWRERRKRAIERADGACQLCASKERLNVHHRTYARLGNEGDSDLTVLCRRCHARFHGKPE